MGFLYNVLANALFACAMSTRDLSTRAGVFYLNLAMGVLLAEDMRQVLPDIYGWNHFPRTATEEELGLVSAKSMRVDDDPASLSATMVGTLMRWPMPTCSSNLLPISFASTEYFQRRARDL